ncbi:MAG: SDR family oxidoreductase [Verrucomicrobia bacterium]|nr:SDR family oxidoreductase [Verrucomicrobiota bacterium]
MKTSLRRFENKSILVTGGSSGIGKATAERFAREGGRVLIFADRPEELRQTANNFRAEGLDVIECPGNVAAAGDVDRAVAQAISAFGRIDVLVSNAGFVYNEPFLEISEEHWDRLMAVNLKGMFLFSQRVARQMRSQGSGGVLLFTASVNGLSAETGLASYNVSKAGIILLMKTLALELAPHRIRANAVCPGIIDTPNTHDFIMRDPKWPQYARSIPWGRAGRPSEVAAAFAFLASDDAEYITGECLVIDGGQIVNGGVKTGENRRFEIIVSSTV